MEYPNCPNLKEKVCVAASDALGMVIHTSPACCQMTCQKYHGPYRGAKPSDPTAFATAMLKANADRSVEKIRATYAGCQIVVPALIEEVKAAFASFRSATWFRGLGITGSALRSDWQRKDVDIRVVVDLDLYLAAERPSFPTEIAGIPADVFVAPKFESVFCTLDIDTLTLYISGLYAPSSIDPSMTVVRNDMDKYVPMPQQAALPRPVTVGRIQPLVKKGACGKCSRAKRALETSANRKPDNQAPSQK
jgi:hypothetical protein